MKTEERGIFYFLVLGIITTVLGFLGLLFKPVLVVIFLSICVIFFICIKKYFLKLPLLSRGELWLSYLFMVLWFLHFLQVLVPETGFDALWYHLPVAKLILESHRIVYDSNLYQTANPLFADLYFLSGFAFFGMFGAKIVAYIFGFFLSLFSFKLSRLFLNRYWALLVTISISVFQVISWQSASFYVDLAKAFFEIVGLYFLLYSFQEKNQRYLIHSLLFFSASLATKLFSIALIPVILSFFYRKLYSNKLWYYGLLLFCLPLPYYLFTYFSTGNPFYSLTLHIGKLEQIGGERDFISFLFERTFSLHTSLREFVFARDYVFPPLVLFFPFLLLNGKNILLDIRLRAVLFFSVWQWLIWWFLPPTSTRYAISGFISFLVLGVYIIMRYFLQKNWQKKLFIFCMLVSICVLLIPRILVAKRSLWYILTPQTQTEYLKPFYDGSIDEKINNWYKSEK